MPHLLLVDDDLFLLRALKKLLTVEGYVCVTAETAEEAWKSLQAEAFDLILLDVILPKQDGFALCRWIRTRYHLPILFLSAREEIVDTITGLEVGGDDYLTKPFDPRELVARVRARLRRSAEYDRHVPEPTQIVLGNLVIDGERRQVLRNGIPVDLTTREFNLLFLLAQHRDKVLASQWIIENVWGPDTQREANTLSVYIRRVRLKIEQDPDHPSLLLTMRGFGYKITGDDAALKS